MIGERETEGRALDDPARRRVEAVVRREAPDLLAYFERRASPEDAADLLGETLLVVWRRAVLLPDHDEHARMWMFGIARKVLAGARRGSVRRIALVDRLRAEARVLPADVRAPDPALTDAIDRLDPLDAEIIRLVHWDGFTLVEVGRLLHRPAGTIRSRYARARATLREALAER